MDEEFNFKSSLKKSERRENEDEGEKDKKGENRK